jgi:predicted nicotinamide N-methyase
VVGSSATKSLQGLRVIEIGCGLGLPALVAAARGAKVLATDWYPAALAVLRENARRNLAAPIETMELDWLNPPDWLSHREPFDLVLGADILYELRYAGALTELVPRLVAQDGEALIADPRRAYAGDFVEHMVEAGWAYELTERKVTVQVDEAGPIVRLHRLRPPAVVG